MNAPRYWPRARPLAGGPLPPLELAQPGPGIAPDRSVRLAELSPHKKRAVWDWLKANDPDTAAFLQSEHVRQVMQAFPGTTPVLDIDVVEQALA